MKNKNVKLGILVLAAVVLFTATAFAMSPTNEGYEALKQIMKDSQAIENFDNATFDGLFQVSDNGKVIAEVTGKVKGNHEGNEASGNLQVNMMGNVQDLSFYKSSEAAYLVDENNVKYYQFTNMNEEMNRKHEYYSSKEHSGGHGMSNTAEALMDFFVGDLKSQFELSGNADGSKSVTLDLDQNEIPAPINLIVGLAVENKSGDYDSHSESRMNPLKKAQLIDKLPFLEKFTGIENAIPELKEDVKLTGLLTKLNFDADNKLQSIDFKMNINGRDENGTIHEIIFSGSVAISYINSTAIDTFDLAGKNIEIIDCRELQDKNNNID